MLTRTPPTVQIDLQASSSNNALSLPGLVSSLRPIKRISTQLDDELNLIHRFSYKNKNQHKASVWWKRVIHVDRTLHRTLEEVESLLSQFGWSKDSDEVPNIQAEQLIRGLLQLPRSLVLVEKSIQVLLNCASILEQLIETKAFLAFILVIVSLIARLHILSLVLHDELSKLSAVLLNLVETNKLSNVTDPLIAKLPKSLRTYVSPQNSIPSLDSTSDSTPVPRSDFSGGAVTLKGDDLGDVVVRKPPTKWDERQADVSEPSTKKKRISPSPPTRAVPFDPPETSVTSAEDLPLPPPRKKKKLKVVQEQAEGKNASLFPFSLDSSQSLDTVSFYEKMAIGDEEKMKKKKDVVKDGLEKPPKLLKEKKKKKARKSMDEIDAIFG